MAETMEQSVRVPCNCHSCLHFKVRLGDACLGGSNKFRGVLFSHTFVIFF